MANHDEGEIDDYGHIGVGDGVREIADRLPSEVTITNHTAEPVTISALYCDLQGTWWIDWKCERCGSVYSMPIGVIVPGEAVRVELPRRVCNGRI